MLFGWVVASTALGPSLTAQTTTFDNGAGSNLWSDPANWSSTVVPDNGADGAVHVSHPGRIGGPVVIDGSYTMKPLTIEPGATLVIGDGNTLRLRGDVTMMGKFVSRNGDADSRWA